MSTIATAARFPVGSLVHKDHGRRNAGEVVGIEGHLRVVEFRYDAPGIAPIGRELICPTLLAAAEVATDEAVLDAIEGLPTEENESGVYVLTFA